MSPVGPRARAVPAAPAGQAHRGAQAVRIIGGRWRGSRLPVAHSPGLRPTPDRVRETLFNWLGQTLSGWRCLDAFAGSGALGFEAASRGAQPVLLLERDGALVRSLRESATRLQAPGEAVLQVQQADALAWMRAATGTPFDLVLLDPPFGVPGLQAQALAAAAPRVSAGGWLYLESPEPLLPDALPAGLALWRQGRAGAVHYHLLQRNE